ncbi:MAG: DUF2974 domain-containing protein, partial [Clostridia bacterium]|nr:DUF2974 domain-containing protein [Clostridia bacterium]
DWELDDILRGKQNLRIGVYKKDINGRTYYALVFKGTTPHSLYDWNNNFSQPFGLSPDVWDALRQTKKFVAEHPDANVIVSGHSKGGAEGLIVAMNENLDAIVFNTSKPYPEKYNIDTTKYTARADSYVVEGEILNSIFKEPDMSGVTTIYLDSGRSEKNLPTALIKINGVDAIKRHLMEDVINSLK